MHFTLTTKHFKISEKDYKVIVKLTEKLLQFTPWKDPDFPLLDIIIRKHKKKSRNHQPLHGHETIDNPVYYDGTVDLILPKKRLVTKMLGKTVHEAIKDGFDELFGELETYKGRYFRNDSEYFDHETIRKQA